MQFYLQFETTIIMLFLYIFLFLNFYYIINGKLC